MSIHDKFFPGTSVSRYLPTGGRAWEGPVFQSGKPVLDSELNLAYEVGQEFSRLFFDPSTPSGWLRSAAPNDPQLDFATGSDPNTLEMGRKTAFVAGIPVVVEYTNTTTAGLNVLEFDAAPVFGGAPPDVKRTDFAFLEVWRTVVSSSPRAAATWEVGDNADITVGDTVVLNGVPLEVVAGAPGVDEFQLGINAAATAANFVAAVNNPANSVDGIAAAVGDPTDVALVHLRAADAFAGAAGNALTLSLTQANAGAMLVNGVAGPTTFSGGANTGNKPTQATIYRHGNVLSPVGVALPDDIADPIVGSESTKRVQVQYRIRVTGAAEAVNFKTEAGLDNPNILAQGSQAAPVALYPFVPADGTSSSSNSDAGAYERVDSGLWIAGDGTLAAANALGTVDGYVYAIPLCFVFRRNDAFDGGAGDGWSPLSNTNGALPQTHGVFINPVVGSIPANGSDRPDARFHDELLSEDVLDLRRHVIPAGLSLQAEVVRQMALLLDGRLGTWAIDAADKNTLGGGSGDVGTQFLVCNEIGRSAAKGGVAPASGSTNRGDSIANFDHVRRRFSDAPTVERVIFPIAPNQLIGANAGLYVTKETGGYTTWQEGDVVHIDLAALTSTGLGDWSAATSGTPTGGGAVADMWPSGTKVTGVLRVTHDDGNFGGAISKEAALDQVVGVGTTHIEITLGANNRQANGGLPGATYDLVVEDGDSDDGSPRRLFVELEITYPAGSGTTDTPVGLLAPEAAVYPYGPLVEGDAGERPDDWDGLLIPTHREGKREVGLEYIANDGSGESSGVPITETFVSDDASTLTLSRRIWGSSLAAPVVTDENDSSAHTVDDATSEYGSSSRILKLDAPLSGAQTLVTVEYFAQDAIPNWGTAGYQVSVYYRATAPQTLGVQAGSPGSFPLPSTLQVQPLAMAGHLWSGTVGAGSTETGFPYSNPSDAIAVHGSLFPGTFPGEWAMQGTAQVSVGSFSADTGVLTLGTLIPMDPKEVFSFTDVDVDSDFRAAYTVADPFTYRPTVAAQPLSGPQAHKTWFPILAKAVEDSTLFRKGEVLLLVFSRFGLLDDKNVLRFTDVDNDTCVAVYRTKGLLLLAEI